MNVNGTSFKFIIIMEQDIVSVAGRLKWNKSSGNDDASSYFLKILLPYFNIIV